MRIISKFHDYYDSVMRMGMDKECIYFRDSTEIILDKLYNYQEDLFSLNIESINNVDYNGNNSDFQSEKFIVGFCGKIYPCIKERISWQDYCYNHESEILFHYSKETIDEKKYNKYSYKNSFFDKNWVSYEHYFEKYKVPIFVILPIAKYNESKKLILNPQLKQYEFFKMKDSYTAYQEIFMFLSGVLGSGQKEIVNISDIDKIKKKGFDKFSFRKVSTKIK